MTGHEEVFYMIKRNRINFHPVKLIIMIAIVVIVTIFTIWNNIRISQNLADTAKLISYKSIGKLTTTMEVNMRTGLRNHEKNIAAICNILSHMKTDENRINSINDFSITMPDVTYGLVDMSGYMHITGSSNTVNVKDEEFFKKCAYGGATTVTTVANTKLPGENNVKIAVAKPLILYGDNKISYIVCGFIDPETMVSSYEFDTGIIQILLTDSSGSVLACTHYSNQYKNLTSLKDLITNPDMAKQLAPIDKHSPDNVYSFTEDNIIRYIYHTPNVFSDWSLYTSVVINPVYKDTRYDSTFLACFNIFFVIVIMVVIFVYTIPLTREAGRQRVAETESMMLAKISHELKTPLNTIMGVGEILAKSNLTNGQLREVSYINEAGNNMLAMINDILDMSKIEAGKFKLAEEEYEFESIIYDLTTIASVRLNHKPVELITDVSPTLPRYMIGDMQRVRQLLSNIVTNAVKYTHKGYIIITIDCEFMSQASINLIVSVKDTGIGMTKDNIDHLFDSYVRFDTKNNSKVEGSGLGMTIAKQFVKLMHGDISVTSEYGEGSEFKVTIRQRIAKKEAIVPKYMPSDPLKKILILESSPVYREYYSKCLDRAGVEYKIAGDNFEFSNHLTKEDYDYVIADHSVISMLKEEGALSAETRLITLTYSHNELIEEEHTIFAPLFSLRIYSYLSGAKKRQTKKYDIGKSFFIHTMPNKRVLIVDDNEMNLQVAAAVMKPYKMHIDCADSGEKALQMIQAADYDLVFMDHMMPGMDGEETLNAIRKLKGEKYRKLPVIVLTANASRDARDIFIRMGFQDFIPKPLEIRALNSKLQKWLKPSQSSPIVEYKVDDEAENAKSDHDKNIYAVEASGDIDVKEGINRIGSISIYIKTLKNFYNTIGKKRKTIKNAFPSDMKTFVVEVHGLKGLAAMVSANKLARLSLDLENKGKANDISGISSVLEDYLEYLATFEELLKEMIDRYS